MRYNEYISFFIIILMKKPIPHLKYEKSLWQKGYQAVVGVDESGCGPWAGPVLAAAVILPQSKRINKIKDSKLLNQKLREDLYKKIYQDAIDVGIGLVDTSEIDNLGIRKASIKAMKNALIDLRIKPDFILIDAFEIDVDLPQKSIIKGDTISISIAAASIIAKVERDRLMLALHKKYPIYGFDKHKGYGTKLHQKMLKAHGPSDVHRRSFKPIKDLL
jgi:ribonuclease HII